MSLKIGKFLIEQDQWALTLSEQQTVKDTKLTKAENVGKTYYSLVGYYGDLSGCFKRIIDRCTEDGVAESKSMKAILESIKQTKQEIDDAYRGMKLAQQS